MATSILSACNLNDPISFLFIKENTDIDGSFLLSSLISQRLKEQNSGTIMICTHHTFDHYNSCCMKLGCNLSSSVAKNILHVIEPMKDVLRNDDITLNSLLENIKVRFATYMEQNVSKVNIFIDDLQFYANFGSNENEMIKFSHQLKSLSTTENARIVLKMNVSNLYAFACNNIEDISDVVIDVNELKSGKFKEVDGKLVIQKKTHAINENLMISEAKNILYKANDRNIKVFAPGEIGLRV